MDIGSVRPVITGITTPVPKAPAQSDQAVETDLPVRAAVNEAVKPDGSNVGTSTDGSSSSATVTGKLRHAKRMREEAEKVDDRVEIDSATRQMIFQKVDTDSGDIIRQVPEESALRMHAMIQAWEGSAGKGRTQAYDASV